MLLKNDLLHYTAPRPRTVRILWIDSAKTIAYTYELSARSAHPQLVALTSLMRDIQHKRAQLLLVDPFLVEADPATLPPSHLQLQARAWKVVSALAPHEPAIYQPAARGRMVAACSEAHGVSYPSVYRYLRRYWERGQNQNALLPDYKNSGAPGKTRGASADIKRGRPRKDGAHPGMNADTEVRATFRAAVARYAATHTAFSRRGAYRQMLEDFFRMQEPDALPTFGQFNYWIERDACVIGRYAAVRKNERPRVRELAQMAAA
jgi:hypothetical protein